MPAHADPKLTHVVLAYPTRPWRWCLWHLRGVRYVLSRSGSEREQPSGQPPHIRRRPTTTSEWLRLTTHPYQHPPGSQCEIERHCCTMHRLVASASPHARSWALQALLCLYRDVFHARHAGATFAQP